MINQIISFLTLYLLRLSTDPKFLFIKQTYSFKPISYCSNSYQNLEKPTTIIKELNDLTTSFVQAYRANIQPRVYDLTEDVVFLCLLIAIIY